MNTRIQARHVTGVAASSARIDSLNENRAAGRPSLARPPGRPGRLMVAIASVLAWMSSTAAAAELVETLPLTDRILMLHFNEGHVVHHQRGQSRSDERVVISPLDTNAAARASTYLIRSPDDPAYRDDRRPLSVGRKSKGTDFAWFVDKWENGRAVNARPDHTKEHWIYLELPSPLQPGRTYTVNPGGLAGNETNATLRFDIARSRSEAVHVNTLGYVPTAPEKYAYVYHWLGDRGSLELPRDVDRSFYLVETNSGTRVLSGKVRFRLGKDQPETAHKSDSPPFGNFLGADVWECDFSTFQRPGVYVVAVEGVGCSWPFRIDPDVYRPAFATVARALYHNRSGLALQKPFTEFERPAPHNPRLTPGFAGRLMYTTVRFTEWGGEGGNAALLKAGFKGPLESAGWYQDAGDWDSYYSHLRVAQELLLVYEMAPAHFTDGELNLPESGNGVPDILDEAAWLPRFCQRLRHELMAKKYGTGGLGLRIAGDAFGDDEKTLPDGRRVGQGSWEDVNRTWAASGEDPWSTYGYAGAAAHLAFCLGRAHATDPEGIDWRREAAEAYAWAGQNTRPGDDAKGPALREPRAYAAAALFRITGDRAYERQFATDTADVTPQTILGGDRLYGPVVYALAGGETTPDASLHERMRAAVLATADAQLAASARRALRWGGDWSMPMLIGQQTTPLVLPAAAGYALTRSQDPGRAARYLGMLYTTCDYFLGCNSLNQTWVTSLGPRFPTQIFHMDAWYNGKERLHPGLIPYSPWRKEKDQGAGPWDQAWPHATLYPAIDAWPGNERWFSNRCSPMGSEFTIHQNIAPAAAIFGFLCGDAPAPTESRTHQ